MVKRRALVTGGTGGLGRTLVRLLIESGYHVTATGRDIRIGATLQKLGAAFLPADLLGDDLKDLAAGKDVVFHLAALSSPWATKAEFQAINVSATRRLLDISHKAGCSRFVYASTPSIYAEPRDRIGLTEASAPAGRFANGYAASKFEAEQEVLAADAPDFRTVSLRPRAIVGPHDRVLLPRLMRLAKKGRVPLPGGGKALVELTDVRDVSRAFILADQALERVHGRVFNLSGGQPRQVRMLLETIFSELGLSVSLRAVPASLAMTAGGLMERIASCLPGRPEPPITRYSVMTFAYSQTFDLSAARNELGWEPIYLPEEAIRAAIRGMKEDA